MFKLVSVVLPCHLELCRKPVEAVAKRNNQALLLGQC